MEILQKRGHIIAITPEMPFGVSGGDLAEARDRTASSAKK
jgi:hypothetical protein